MGSVNKYSAHRFHPYAERKWSHDRQQQQENAEQMKLKSIANTLSQQPAVNLLNQIEKMKQQNNIEQADEKK